MTHQRIAEVLFTTLAVIGLGGAIAGDLLGWNEQRVLGLTVYGTAFLSGAAYVRTLKREPQK
jgi:hypothetical protein